MIRLFVVEAIRRAALKAKEQKCTIIEPKHVEEIVGQLLLDF